MINEIMKRLSELPNVTLSDGQEYIQLYDAMKTVKRTGRCKDCKWWKDSDGVYRRGVGAESKCPINNVSVNHGLGYCYMFEPQEGEGKK